MSEPVTQTHFQKRIAILNPTSAKWPDRTRRINVTRWPAGCAPQPAVGERGRFAAWVLPEDKKSPIVGNPLSVHEGDFTPWVSFHDPFYDLSDEKWVAPSFMVIAWRKPRPLPMKRVIGQRLPFIGPVFDAPLQPESQPPLAIMGLPRIAAGSSGKNGISRVGKAKSFTNFCPDCFTRSEVTKQKQYGLYVQQQHHDCGEWSPA